MPGGSLKTGKLFLLTPYSSLWGQGLQFTAFSDSPSIANLLPLSFNFAILSLSQPRQHAHRLLRNMGSSARPSPNAAGTGNISSFNTTNSYNTTTNITYGDERAKLLKWLSPLQPGARHCEVRARRQDGLGERLLQSDEFLRWRDDTGESGKATLFCSGNPGVGKTLLR